MCVKSNFRQKKETKKKSFFPFALFRLTLLSFLFQDAVTRFSFFDCLQRFGVLIFFFFFFFFFFFKSVHAAFFRSCSHVRWKCWLLSQRSVEGMRKKIENRFCFVSVCSSMFAKYPTVMNNDPGNTFAMFADFGIALLFVVFGVLALFKVLFVFVFVLLWFNLQNIQQHSKYDKDNTPLGSEKK